MLAIVRFHVAGDLDATLAAVMAGGIEVLEVTLDTPGALDAIERAAGHGTAIGAGTVVTTEQVRACADRGARFVVSPGLDRAVVEAALGLSIVPIPGVWTPTEIITARALGLNTVKLFPASVGGPSHLRTVRAPFPSVGFVPTGGIGVEEVAPYLEAGALSVGLGGSLIGAKPPGSAGELDAISSRAARAMASATGVHPEQPS